MLHIGHDNHHVVLLPEAISHPHHTFSASSNSKTLKLSSDACRMAGWDEVLQGKQLSFPIPHLSLTQIHRTERPFSDFVYDAENLGQLRDGFVEQVNIYFHIP